MRKNLFIILILLLVLPISVFAKTYSVNDMTVSIDEANWYVFTRNNLNNEKLTEAGLSYDRIKGIMDSYDIYFYALTYDKENTAIELYITVKPVSGVNNLHTYSRNEINNLGEMIKDGVGAKSFDIYSVGKYEYIYLNYYDSSKSYYIDEYYTVINGYGYTLIVQKEKGFYSYELLEFKNILNSASYKYDSNYEKNEKENSLFEKFIIGAFTAGILGGISLLSNKKGKKSSEKANKK